MMSVPASWSEPVRRSPLLRDRANAAVTAVLGVGVLYFGARFAQWAVLSAIWRLPPGSTSAICRAARGEGACWAVVGERFRFILLGAYPAAQPWRPLVACGAIISLYAATAVRAWWRPWLAACWIAVPALAIVLLRGGIFGLPAVPTDVWGGLPLTLVLATVGFVAAIPPAAVLALGRRSPMPAIRILSASYIELVRGVPIITLLFMASIMFPRFVPQGLVVDKLVRAQIAVAMVAAAYLAEVIRAGLETIPSGQYEAATSLGLRFWPATILVVLPQAVRKMIPALVNTFIAFVKDTSLVAIIGVFDLLGAAKVVIVDPKWTGFGVEVYLFVAAIYFSLCFAVSRYSQRLERT
jgi:general L-amino acid transport system permease protein